MTEVLKIQALIQKRKQKECQCKNRTLIVDPVNRKVECSACGQWIDPINALLELCELDCQRSREIDYLISVKNDLVKWLQRNRAGQVIKDLAERYRRGEMIPSCPCCHEPFDLEELRSHTWYGKEYIARRKAKKEAQND